MLDMLLMSTKAGEDFKREWSVSKKFHKREYLYKDKSRDHITSAIKSSNPDASHAHQSTSALQILLQEIQEDIH